MREKPYIAHSELIDKEKNKNIPSQPYEDHIKGVYNGCLNSIKRIISFVNPVWQNVFKKSVLYAAIYHDLGKLDDQAQAILYGEIKGKMINHVDAGVALLLSKYAKTKDICFLIASYLVVAHHIGLPNYNKVIKTEKQMLSLILSPTVNFRDLKSIQKYSMGNDSVEKHIDKNLLEYLNIHNGLCNFSIGEIEINKHHALSFMGDPVMLKIAISVLVDADHEDTSVNYDECHPVKTKRLAPRSHLINLKNKVAMLEKEYESGKIHCSEERFKLRQEFFKVCDECGLDSSFFLVDGTVGIGKTLAIMNLALRIAEEFELDSIIFILPYISLIDQSAQEYIDSIFTNPSDATYGFNVIHSVFKTKNVFHRKYSKGFNAPISITTSVNFFNILSSNCTSLFRNAHKFVGSVIVIDEYDAIAGYEYWPVILSMMKDLADNFSCKFIFSSGTPVRFWDIDDIQKITGDTLSVKEVINNNLYNKMIKMEEKRVKIINSIQEQWDFEKLAGEVLKEEKSVFIILNTRKKSVAFTNLLIQKTTRKVYLRFSGLSPKDRRRQYNEIKTEIQNQNPIIVVATQGSDIGLNLSFYCGFKESSSYSSALQMKGRVNRGCEFLGSYLHIFKLCKEPNSDGVKYYNPSIFKYKSEVFESEKEFHKNMSPEYITAASEKEINNMPTDAKNKMRDLFKMWNDKNFDEVNENFSLIDMPMIHLLVDADIFKKLKEGDYVPYHEMQNSIVSLIWSDKNMDLIKGNVIQIDEELMKEENNNEDEESEIKNNVFGLYFWKGDYDPKNFGVFADPVFKLLDSKVLLI